MAAKSKAFEDVRAKVDVLEKTVKDLQLEAETLRASHEVSFRRLLYACDLPSPQVHYQDPRGNASRLEERR